MENLTWRMMALALRKKREEDAAKKEEENASATKSKPIVKGAPLDSETVASVTLSPLHFIKDEFTDDSQDAAPRGRRIDKGKAKTRVEGFDDGNAKSDDECVPCFPLRISSY
jgi:GATA-binding protein